jgi:FkbM family methyltransferase
MGNKKHFEFKRENKTILVSLEEDHYGRDFWEKFSNWEYEPDTQALLKAFCTPKTLFIDIGAAYGSLSLTAAAHGADVWCFEPNPRVFDGLVRNISLNRSLGKRIKVTNCAISDVTGHLTISNESNNRILSPIVFTAWESRNKVEVRSLGQILEETLILKGGKAKNLLIKMDIEGAEWKILSNKAVLQKLTTLNCKVILALHPGLHRPLKSGCFANPRKLLWNLRNCYDSWRLFSRLKPISSVYRVNLNQVKRPTAFTLLTLAGNHEYFLIFGENKLQ